ncbi:MAG TPA: carboxypeptidase regulatory-like domain-containing protein [Candidatus Hydrogenedentes bacterium]|nr:carboxypeptidase regulatory-like domain-containing protein [Candidatus Hydrogenedentota bacterium]
MVSHLTGPGGADFCYLGHMVMNEEGALALLDEYEQWGVEAFRETNTTLDVQTYDGEFYSSDPTVYRLREGIERLLVEPFPPAPEVARARASIPVLWQMPDRNPWGGGLVLDFDRHLEWKPYPGEFPMTEHFIRRVREIMETAPSTPSNGAFISGQLGIGGRVTAPDGKPLEGVRVFVHDPRTKDTGEWRYTDDDGRYTVSGLSDTSYNLYVTKRAHETARRRGVAGGSTNVDFCLIPLALQAPIR